MADDYFLSGSTLQASTAVADANGRRYVIPKIQLVDASGNYAGPRGQTTSANSQSVVPASDSAPFPVVGNVAPGGVSTGGNPVQVAGTDGTNVRTIRTDNTGRATVRIVDGNGTDITSGIAGNDAVTTAVSSLSVSGFSRVFNGSTWDRARGDTNGAWNVATASGAAAVGLTPATAVNATSVVVKASAGNFYGGTIVAGATAGFLIAYNATTAPASGATLTAAQILGIVPVAANGSAALGEYTVPDRFSTGVVLLFSTSTTTYTLPANNAAFLRGRAM